jgi:hypothetical protein
VAQRAYSPFRFVLQQDDCVAYSAAARHCGVICVILLSIND